MLSDVDIDNLIAPFVDRQQDLESYIIETIATRVNQIGKLLPKDVYRLEQLYKYGSDTKKINKAIANTIGIQEKEVKKMIKSVAIDSYNDAKPYYDYRHRTQIPYEKNEALQETVETISNETAGTFTNLSDSRATGFSVTPTKSKTKQFRSVVSTYQDVIDRAVQAVYTGVLDFNSAMKMALKELVDSGYRRAYWDSGYSRRLDSTVRMNILGGLRHLNEQLQRQIIEETDADGIEISAHDFSAPDHEPIQGHIFRIEEFDKLQSEQAFTDTWGNRFNAIKRPIGEWNCRHFIQAVVVDAHKPTWDYASLQELKARNAKGYTTKDGKHYTMYQCSQVQRQYETDIRYAKEGYMMAKKAGNTELMTEYEARLAKLNAEYSAFSKACGLSKQRKRAQVRGFEY